MMIHSTRGRSRKRVRRELRVDGSSFIRRRTDQSNDSADCAETLLNTRDTLFVCQPLSLSLYLLYASLPRCLDAPSIISSRFTYVFATDNSVWTNLVSFDVRCRVDTSLFFFFGEFVSPFNSYYCSSVEKKSNSCVEQSLSS